MANVLINEDTMSDIADAIRAKKGVSTTYKPSEMPSAISTISGGGGITPTGTKTINISANGTFTEDITNYASVQIIVNVEGGGGGGLLPSEYQQVEYIQSSGAQIINVDSNFLVDTPISLECSDASGSALIGYSAGQGCWFGNSNGNYNVGGSLSLDISSATHVTASLEYRIGASDKINLYGEVNGTSKTAAATITQAGLVRGLTLFGAQSNSTTTYYYASAKVYRVTIGSVHDLVPCYRKADSVIGMYDIITDTFFTNSGSGAFTKGADV